ncbi:MAG: glycogen debranching protein GlgX [Oscillochloris sp.]|nr:glycogen debranching protein GlgX [Oscillochloris sp.]
MPAVWPGKPYPLGATWDGNGVNFALFSAHATRVELCLFDSPDTSRESSRIALPERSENIWHGYIPGLAPGQLYGYRVYGPYNPNQGHRFNPHKLLIDPYAKALSGTIQWDKAMYAYRVDSPYGDLTIGKRDSAPYMPRSVVIDPRFDWGDGARPNTPLHDSLIYEVHVKGFTQLHPDVPLPLRGTYAGLASDPAIEYLQKLGVTAVELLPIQQFVADQYLVDKGLTNYWGYQSIGFFAPDARYSSAGALGEQVNEFKQMVRRLHAAGIELILDVVYNHTGEGNHLGPSLSFRGVDNASYYRLVPDNPRYYMDYTGTGNSLNTLHPRVLQMVIDSLRYWVQEMHVDGFRFDLARTLVRGAHDADRPSAFFDVIKQDPVLSQVKLIAEPWDVGPDGYWVGRFPAPWAEWNGKYRDNVRKFWKGDGGQAPELASRIMGSSDLYRHNGRRPYHSVNFITAHDGFTMRDLVSYNEKHNEANGEGNRDGDSHNNSWNHGVEGPTDNPEIVELRERQIRNMLATLLLSQGTPMLLGGDERGRTQHGNNNAYCQDNEISWFDWSPDPQADALLKFTRQLIALRKAHPILHRRNFFLGQLTPGGAEYDVEWLSPDGQEIGPELWNNPDLRCIGLLLNGKAMREIGEQGKPVRDDVLLILFNAGHEPVPFILPDWPDDPVWEVLIDTAHPNGDGELAPSSEVFQVEARGLVVLREQVSATIPEPVLEPTKVLRRALPAEPPPPPADEQGDAPEPPKDVSPPEQPKKE